jgi:hypothetical protein
VTARSPRQPGDLTALPAWNGPGSFPPAADPRWSAYKEAYYKLLLRGSDHRAPGGADHAGHVLARQLARLAPAPDARAGMAAAVFDRADDLGRHVVAKRIVHDGLEPALREVSAAMRACGLGVLETAEAFHREARVAFAPGPAADGADPDLLQAHVAGLLHGALGAALNCEVAVATGPGVLEVRLARGRDVNQEVPSRG